MEVENPPEEVTMRKPEFDEQKLLREQLADERAENRLLRYELE